MIISFKTHNAYLSFFILIISLLIEVVILFLVKTMVYRYNYKYALYTFYVYANFTTNLSYVDSSYGLQFEDQDGNIEKGFNAAIITLQT